MVINETSLPNCLQLGLLPARVKKQLDFSSKHFSPSNSITSYAKNTLSNEPSAVGKTRNRVMSR